jgi:predicted amidophosphoribosyltransferase
MVLFKEKKKNTNNKTIVKTTIDSKHNQHLKSLLEKQNELPILKEKLEKLQLEWDSKYNKPNSELTSKQIDEKLDLRDLMAEIQEEINKLEKNIDLKEYLTNTSHILYEFSTKSESFNSSTKTNNSFKKKSVMDFFSKEDNNEKIETKSNEEIGKSMDKGDLINVYMSILDPEFIKTLEEPDGEELNRCKVCGHFCTTDEDEGVMICDKCGAQQKILIENDLPSYKEPPREITYFAYKRINHFNEWLAQFQAKETTDIKEDIFEKIKTELKKEKIIDMKTLKATKVRDILKKLSLQRYYEHSNYITNRLSGIPAPVIDNETEEKLKNMFRDIQGPWMKFCPDDRSNFFSYPFVLFKCLQLLEKDELLKHFRLLKSREKLAEQDSLWRKICEDLRWEFIRTV